MRYSIMKVLISGCLSFIMVTSAIDSYGAVSNMSTESMIEENNIESNTDTAKETIIEEKGIDSVPQEVEETTVEVVEQVEEKQSEEPKPTEKIDTPTVTEQPIEQPAPAPAEQSTPPNGLVSIGTYKLTAYCPCSKCCGKWAGGNTASGTVPTQGRTVACNTLAAGTRININGNDYIVEDTGNMKGNVIDIFFNSHQEALNFGVRYAEVFVYSN